MSTQEESHSRFKRESGSQDPPPYDDTLSATDIVDDMPQTTQRPEIENLGMLDDESVNLFLEQKELAKEQLLRGAAEKAVPIGIYRLPGKTTVVLPDSWRHKDDSHIGAMIYDFSLIAGFEIRLNGSEVKRTMAYNKDYLLGLWFGIYSTTNQKRRRGKKNYELGRTQIFSLIVKNVFERSKYLGSAALVKDNFFFGNYPEEKSNKEKVGFNLKTRLAAMFDKPEAGNLLYGILNLTAASVGFSYLTDDERDKVITDNLIPVDQVITACYPAITIKKKKQEVTKTRKPNPIRSSPLFTKEEISLVSRFSSSIFADLGYLASGYESAVLSNGFVEVSKRIREIINVRWETLQRFAHVTKIRLQDIRKIIQEPTIRKAKVTQDHVRALLQASRDPASRLVDEMMHIIGRVNPVNCYSYAFNNAPSNPSQVRRLLYIKSHDLYETIGFKKFDNDIEKFRKETSEVIEIDFEKGIKFISEIESLEGNLQKNITNVRSIKYFKLFGRNKQIEANLKSIQDLVERSGQINEISLNVAVELYTNGKFNNFQTWRQNMFNKIFESLDWTITLVQLRLKEETDENVKNVIIRLYKILQIGYKQFDEKNLGRIYD